MNFVLQGFVQISVMDEIRWNIVLLTVKTLSHLPMKHQGLLLCARGGGLAVAGCFSTSSDPSLTSKDQQHSPPIEVWALPSILPLRDVLHLCPTDLYHPSRSMSVSARRPRVTCFTPKVCLLVYTASEHWHIPQELLGTKKTGFRAGLMIIKIGKCCRDKGRVVPLLHK